MKSRVFFAAAVCVLILAIIRILMGRILLGVILLFCAGAELYIGLTMKKKEENEDINDNNKKE